MHYHYIEDANGDLVELVAFCSAGCHRDWCADNGFEYPGWNGCQKGGDSAEFCVECGVFAGGTHECGCQSDNVVVGRFPSQNGERCEAHGNWIQLPERMLER